MYRYFLQFENEPIREVEIFEPFGMDGATFTIEQKSNKFARDVFVFNEDIELEFTNSVYDASEVYYNIEGKQRFYLGHGLDYIFDAIKNYGCEATINFVIRENDIDFISQSLDFENYDTDNKTYFKCKTIEDNKRSLHKIREDIKVNIYATTDLDGNTITPLVPTKILLQSKPTVSRSKWDSTDNIIDLLLVSTSFIGRESTYFYYNNAQQITLNGISDTLTFLPQASINSEIENINPEVYRLLFAKNTLQNVKVKISDFYLFQRGVLVNGDGYFKSEMKLIWGTSSASPTGSYTYFSTETIDDGETFEFSYDDTFVIDEISQGSYLYLYIKTEARVSDDFGGEFRAVTDLSKYTVEIEASEVTIDTVVEGVRWIDLQKQASLISSGLPVNAPLFDVGGQFYDTFALNGYGIRSIPNRAFSITTQDALESTEMLACDYQIKNDSIEVGTYTDFYGNTEIGVFQIVPSETFNFTPNQKYRAKILDLACKTFEQDRQEQNTLDSVHTSTQWMFPNKKAKNTKKVEIKPILDPYKIESLRRLGLDINTKDTSLNDDDDLVLLDVVQIGATTKEYRGVFTYQEFNNNQLRILSTNFNWTKIGLSVNASFIILEGNNSGNYTILEITPNILTITGNVLFSSGTSQIKFRYFLTGVQFKNRTNEQFNLITGVENPDKFGNLLFSFKRLMDWWLPYLATTSMSFLNGLIKNTFWKNNNNLVTQFNSGLVYTDKADINLTDIQGLKRITDKTFKTTFYASFQSVLNYVEANNTRQIDGSIGGFVRLYDIDGNIIKGYPTKLTYLYDEGKFEGTFEEKYTLDFYEITTENIYLIKWFKVNEIYVFLYDSNDILIENARRFQTIKINGIVFNTVEEFNNALTLLLN